MTARRDDDARIADRLAIHETVLRYCRAVDRGDLAAIRPLYAGDGHDHHTGFDGSADDFVRWLGTKLPQFDGTMHLVGNHLVEFAGDDDAVAESYGTAVHWGTPRDDPARNFTSGFRYVDRFRREGGTWRIAHRTAVREWTRSDAGRLLDPEGPGPRGTRGPDDPLHEARRILPG
ncbi:nuclear transport factor 2 family protein [Herbiconiux sp. P17]|uniref:nuclear transport factor 2 family protein n=1 Tax=Herbiconiux wuyangfengii TaxID=3342794 RepID=UPI0035B7F4AD